MVKKVISFTLILVLVFLVYQFFINMAKSNHYITYSINNGELFEIDEKYKKENKDDYYLIRVKNNDNSFVFRLDNTYNKQKNIVEDIKTFEQDGYYCIALDLIGKGHFSYPECIKNNTLYSYGFIKDTIDFGDFIKEIDDKNRDKYSTESIKNTEYGITVNKGYFDENEVLTVYNYKQVALFYPSYSRIFSFSNMDNYKNTYGHLVGKYYVVPKLTSLPTFSSIVKYDVVDGIKKDIDLPIAISKQSYVNGVNDNKIYIFDKSNKRQFEINPYNDEINIVGSIDEDGITYVNGEKTSISVYDLEKNEVLFEEKKDEYPLDYETIYLNDDSAVYMKNGYYYKVYKDFIESPLLLFYEPEAKNIIFKNGIVYYIKNDTIYKYNQYGSVPLAIKSEFSYNYDNIFDIYLK